VGKRAPSTMERLVTSINTQLRVAEQAQVCAADALASAYHLVVGIFGPAAWAGWCAQNLDDLPQGQREALLLIGQAEDPLATLRSRGCN
jgi:hypothetical protein